MANAAVEAAGPVVEKFAGSAGRWLGYFGMAVALLGVAAIIIDGPSAAWRGTAAAVAVALLSWVVLVRPAVAVHQHGVLMRNMARDSFIPSGSIDRCRSSQTLMIRAGDETFHGLGISRSPRSVMREQRKGIAPSGMSMLGMGGGAASADGQSETSGFANQEVIGSTYAEYVASRIEQLRHDAKDHDAEPITVWATEGVAAVALAAILVVAAIIG